MKDFVGRTPESRSSAAQPSIGLGGDAVAFARLPKPNERKLEERRDERVALDVREQSIHDAGIEAKPDTFRRFLDRLAEFPRIECEMHAAAVHDGRQFAFKSRQL